MMRLSSTHWFLLICFFIPSLALAVVASSPNYVLDRDSINFGGGLGNSTNFSMESTLGESGAGLINGANLNLKAGYQQMDATATISMSASGTVALIPALTANSSGLSTGQVGVVVSTTNLNGYNLYLSANSNPALAAGANSFTDYVPAGSNPDFGFNNASGAKTFGYSPEGADIATRFQDDGSSCNSSGNDTADACWDGLSTTPAIIATRGSNNNPSGTYTIIKLTAGVGSGATVAAGSYTATLIFSAVMQ